MFGDMLVEHWPRKMSVPDGEAIATPSYAFSMRLIARGGIQPRAIGSARSEGAGTSTASKMYVAYFATGVLQEGDEIRLGAIRYSVRNINAWPTHDEVELVRTQGV